MMIKNSPFLLLLLATLFCLSSCGSESENPIDPETYKMVYETHNKSTLSPGDELIIVGKNFGTDPTKVSLFNYFKDVKFPVKSVNNNQITFTIPDNFLDKFEKKKGQRLCRN